MRDIRFRVWDKSAKRMHPWEEVNSIYNFNMVVIIADKNDWMLAENDFILMQYTGLKDKNGKEIYEGDVLGWEELEHKQVVSFNEKNTSITEGHGMYGVDTSYGYHFDSWFSLSGAKIIGNIYENPELI